MTKTAKIELTLDQLKILGMVISAADPSKNDDLLHLRDLFYKEAIKLEHDTDTFKMEEQIKDAIEIVKNNMMFFPLITAIGDLEKVRLITSLNRTVRITSRIYPDKKVYSFSEGEYSIESTAEQFRKQLLGLKSIG